MSREIGVSSVFSYAFRCAAPVNPVQGGFSVNLFDSDILVYTCYDVSRSAVLECRFQLQQGTAERCLQYIDSARWWLKSLPPHLRAGGEQQDTVLVGFAGQPMCCLDGFEQLALCPFGSARGHFTRAVYNLMEDIAALLKPQGMMIRPNDFSWDSLMVRPVQQQRFASRYDAQQQAGSGA